jgi:hypothetical protein
MGADIFHTACDAWDEYWVTHSTYVRTCTIDAGDIGTTDFDITPAQQQWLLKSGRDAGDAFLSAWDPAQYVNGHGRKLASVPATA